MFGPLGVPEIIFLLVLALLIFGPRKLPEIGRTLGKGLAEFRKASNELKRSLNTEGLGEELRRSDPRRVLREELSQPFTSTEDDKPKDEAPAPASGDTAAKAPADTVARTAAGGSDESAGGEQAPPVEAPLETQPVESDKTG